MNLYADQVDPWWHALTRCVAAIPGELHPVTGSSRAREISDGPAGQVEDARVVESTPQGVFDQLVLEAIRGWEFSPAEYKGEKVRVWANQRIRFDLS